MSGSREIMASEIPRQASPSGSAPRKMRSTLYWVAVILYGLSIRSNSSMRTAVVLTMLTVAAVALAGLIFTGFIRSCIPSYVFKDEFHVKPPNDISDIKSSTWSFADSGHTFLRFKASREALSRLLPNHVQMIYYAEFKAKADNWMDDESPPSWWVNPTNGAEIYSIGPQHSEGRPHSGEFVVLIYDASTGTADYYSSWVD